MTLIADAAEPGLWTNDALPDKAKGAHLLLIGISDYPHLYQGSDPAPDHGGMGQLEVSARTALRLFDWLRRKGEFGGVPIASCRLLLSPRGGEVAEAKAVADNHYRLASYAEIDAAIQGWSRSIFAATGEGENVAMLFFSGHGLESFGEKILLARDILDPASPTSRANGLQVYPLVKALKGWGVERAFLFLDACRNDSPAVRALGIEGSVPVKPLAQPRPSPTALPVLLATGAGFFAYQKADEPGTYFGQGLLESLEGAPPRFEPYDRSSTPWRLPFDRLEERVQSRVRELVSAQSANATQLVEADGHPYKANALVALKPPEKPRMGRRRAATRAAPPPGLPEGLGAWTSVENAIPLPSMSVGVEDILASLGIEKAAEKAFSEFTRRELPADGLKDADVMHAAFGHESITGPWVDGLRLVDLETGEPAPLTDLRLQGAAYKEHGGQVASWIDLSVPPTAGRVFWLQHGDGDDARAVALPSDAEFGAPVRLEVIHVDGPAGWRLSELTARVGQPIRSARDPWRTLWEAQKAEQVSSLSKAHQALEHNSDLIRVAARKLRSPLASAMAMVFLLRGGADQPLHDWPRNLANWFDWLPDGGFLWAETLRLRGEDTGDEAIMAEALEYFMLGAGRGVPRLGPVLTMAVRQAAWLSELAAGRPEAEVFGLAAERLRAAALHAAPGSAYAAFAGPGISPALMASPLSIALA